MRQKLKKAAALILTGALMSGTMAYGSSGQRTLKVLYDNIKIVIDGVEYTPKDANGAVVEPFICNGTTYLPVRGVAGAFGKEVEWDPMTSTVYLGDIDFDWLDQMGYADYETTSTKDSLTAIEKGTKAGDGMLYDRGISFCSSLQNVIKLNDGTYESYQEVSYLLNREYKTFEGTLCSLDSADKCHGIIEMYGDGELIYTSPPIAKGTKSTDFDLDVSDYKILKIRYELVNPPKKSVNIYMEAGIADARLSKSY